MNAFATTIRSIGLVGTPRAAQHVHVCREVGSGALRRYQVLVTPAGEKYGEYYEVGRLCLEALRDGRTPEELELETMEQEQADEWSGSSYDLAASRADRDNDMKWGA